jgi:uncharacterized protein YggT (Ycf19 family)
MEICRKHLSKVLHTFSSKQNDRWTTQAQPDEPLILCVHCIVIYITAFDYHFGILDFSSYISVLTAFDYHFGILDFSSYISAVIVLCSFFF